jgi:hypothetical protein
MATRVHRPLKVLAFNANGIEKQSSVSNCKNYLMRGSSFQIIIFIGPTVFRAEKAELPLQLEKESLIIMRTYLPLFQLKPQGSAYQF